MIEQIDKQKNEITNNIEQNSKTVEGLKNQARVLEDRNRRNNLRIDGIKETDKETWNECEEKVLSILEKKLGVNNVIIERAHRMGKRQNDRPRTIIFKLLNYKDKERILRQTKRLKSTGIDINEDFRNEGNKKKPQDTNERG